MIDQAANFFTSLIATAPSPATTGTTAVLTGGDGYYLPSPLPVDLVVAPAGSAPTRANAEIIRVTAVPATKITSGSNGSSLPQSTINCVSTTGFPASGTATVVTASGPQVVAYTGTTGTTFTGCTGGTGAMATNGAIVSDQVTFTRQAQSTSARTVVPGDAVFLDLTKNVRDQMASAIDVTLAATEAVAAGQMAFIHNGGIRAAAYLPYADSAGYDVSIVTTGSGDGVSTCFLSRNVFLMAAHNNGTTCPRLWLMKANETDGTYTASAALEVNATNTHWSTSVGVTAINEYQALVFYYDGSSGGTSALKARIVSVNHSAGTMSLGAESSSGLFYQANPTLLSAGVVVPGASPRVALQLQQGSGGTEQDVVIATVTPGTDTISWSGATNIDTVAGAFGYGIEIVGPTRFVVCYGAASMKAVVVKHDGSGGSLSVGTPATLHSLTVRGAMAKVSGPAGNRFMSHGYASGTLKARGFSVDDMAVSMGTELSVSSALANTNGEDMALLAMGSGIAAGLGEKAGGGNFALLYYTVNDDLTLSYVEKDWSYGSASSTHGLALVRSAANQYALLTNQIGTTVLKTIQMPEATGYAKAAVAAGASGTVQHSGVVSGLSGLVKGNTYYAKVGDGSLTSLPGGLPVGKAISSTQILLFGSQGWGDNFKYLTNP